MKAKISKTTLIIMIVVLSAALVATAVGVTYAIWKDRAHITEDLETQIPEYNASEQYIVFAGLTSTDANGRITENVSEIRAFAVIGYIGLIEEVKIPATHKLNESSEALPVTQILVPSSYDIRGLAENPIITELTIPSSVIYVAAGACMNMNSLNTLILESRNSELLLGESAFAGCLELTTIVGDRAKIAGPTSAFGGTAIA